MANGEIFIQNEVLSDSIEKMKSELNTLDSAEKPQEKLKKSYGPSPYWARSSVKEIAENGKQIALLLQETIRFFEMSAEAYLEADSQSADTIQG